MEHSNIPILHSNALAEHSRKSNEPSMLIPLVEMTIVSIRIHRLRSYIVPTLTQVNSLTSILHTTSYITSPYIHLKHYMHHLVHTP